MKIRIKRNFFQEFIQYILVFAIVLNSWSMWTSLPDLPWFSKFVKAVMIICFCLDIVLDISHGNYILKKNLWRIIIVSIYLLLFGVLNPYNIINYWLWVLSCMILMIGLCTNKQKMLSLFLKYENLMVIIAVVSLFFWIVGSVLRILHPTGYVYSNWTGTGAVCARSSYYNFYFETQSYFNVKRNSAIFTEGPMAAFNFAIALMINVSINEHSKMKKRIILMIALASTLTTTGFVVLLIVIAYLYFDNAGKGKFTKILKWFIAPIVVLFIGLIGYTIVYDKVTNTNSGATRLDDIIAAIKVWKSYPILGAGWQNSEMIVSQMKGTRYGINTGFSSGAMQLLANGGLYLFLPVLLSVIAGIYRAKKKNDKKLLLFIVVWSFLYLVSVVTYQYINVIIIFYISGIVNGKATGKNKCRNHP